MKELPKEFIVRVPTERHAEYLCKKFSGMSVDEMERYRFEYDYGTKMYCRIDNGKIEAHDTKEYYQQNFFTTPIISCSKMYKDIKYPLAETIVEWIQEKVKAK